jgi:hypothetical protein
MAAKWGLVPNSAQHPAPQAGITRKKGVEPEPLVGKIVALVTSTLTRSISAVASSTVASSALAATAALFFRARFIDGEVAAAEVGAVHRLNRFLRLFRRAHRDESETARPASGTVHHEIRFYDRAVGRKGVLQVVFANLEVEIPDE